MAAALAAAGLEQVGGAQDQQGGGVAQLERGDADHQPPEPPAQDRSDPDADRLAGPLAGRGRVADGVDDGQGGEQAGDDGQADGGADADQRDQADGQQRPADRAHARARWTGRTLRVEIEGWVDPGLPGPDADVRPASRSRPRPAVARSRQPELDKPCRGRRQPALSATAGPGSIAVSNHGADELRVQVPCR